MRAPFVQKFFMNNENGSYIIPSMQSGLVTLGGTQDFGHWSQSTSEYNTHSIFDRCRDMMPTLESATVEWHWVGLRPYRHQVRTELEKIGNLLVSHIHIISLSFLVQRIGVFKRRTLGLGQQL